MNYILRTLNRQSFSIISHFNTNSNALTGQCRLLCTAIKEANNLSIRSLEHTTNAEGSNLINTVTSLQDNEQLDKLYTKLCLEIRGVDPAVLKSYSWFATTAANHLGIEVGNCWAERKPRKERMTLLKSVHIFKKHRVQYEIRTYIRYLNFHRLTGSTVDTFLEYIERNLPEGVALLATKTEIQSLPEHLKQPPIDVEEEKVS